MNPLQVTLAIQPITSVISVSGFSVTRIFRPAGSRRQSLNWRSPGNSFGVVAVGSAAFVGSGVAGGDARAITHPASSVEAIGMAAISATTVPLLESAAVSRVRQTPASSGWRRRSS